MPRIRSFLYSLLTLAFPLFTVPSEASQIVARGVWPANSHEYVIVELPDQTWEAAMADLASLLPGYHLATLTSQAEEDFIFELRAEHSIWGQYWLGGLQEPDGEEPAGGWTWFTCEPWDYTNWGSGEPNDGNGIEDHLALDGSYWNDEGSCIGCINGYIAESTAYQPSGLLEIHYINVQQAGATLVVGPTGATVMMDFARSSTRITDYLEGIGLLPEHGLTYTVTSHLDYDHIGGFDNLCADGYDVLFGNLYNGSFRSTQSYTDYMDACAATCAGGPVTAEVGDTIPLGNGATLEVVAVNGDVAGGGHVSVSDENDKSIAVLIRYGEFEFLWAGDLGGGSDPDCTSRSGVSSANVEQPLAEAIVPGGADPKLPAGGVDVLHVNHHGSKESTNSYWMNLLEPEIALISAGNNSQDNPEIVVVDQVLLRGISCIDAPAALVLQTDEGDIAGGSTSGYVVGDIVISTDGLFMAVAATGEVESGSPDERAAAGLPDSRVVDDRAPDCPEDLVLSDLRIDSAWTWKAESSIAAGSDFRVLAGGEVTLEAGIQITLGDRFAVEGSGELALRLEPVLDCS